MNRKKIIVGYEVRNKNDNGIRLCRLYLQEAKDHCPFRKVQYDKYSNVFNFFNLYIGWELMKRTVPLEIVYEPKDEPKTDKYERYFRCLLRRQDVLF